MKTTSLVTDRRRGLKRAFTLVEMVVASGISTLIFTVGALSYQAITSQQRVSTTYGTVEIGGAQAENYYGKPEGVTAVDAYFAPNFGRSTTADSMREKFYEDVDQATAVFCLGRDDLSPARPASVTFDASMDGRAIDTPEKFLAVLEDSVPLLSGVHNAYDSAGCGKAPGKNLSVYILQPSFTSNPGTLIITAIYEIDMLATTSPVGTYASVRRYSFSYLTDVYDVFYPTPDTGAPTPLDFTLAVAFEREVRKIPASADAGDKFRVAKQSPFYFMWWPDPSAPDLNGDALTTAPSYSTDDPRGVYYQMGGRTSYMFTFPMFPAL